MVRRSDIIRAYNNAIAQRAQHQHRVEVLRLGQLDGTGFAHVHVPSHSPAIGKRISEITLPQECLIVSIRRGRKLHVPHGYTVIQNGDKVTVFAHEGCMPVVHECLTGQPTPDSQSK
jgi:Trk K+ transport system NAD-binding subunit